MALKINNIEQSEIESENERRWFSTIKQLAKETGFGRTELVITVKNGKITNISQVKINTNYNIGC